jgi:hypothetical protein
MTVQIQPAKPKDQHNGLADIEAQIMADPSVEITAVVTYKVAKIVDDLKKDEQYPVLYAAHIEVAAGQLETQAKEIQQAAYKVRTGEDQLDLDFEPADDGDGDDE